MTASAPPPGFYDDPQDPERDRWWDGAAWTDVTREAVADDRPGPLEAGGLVDALPDQLKGLYERHKDDAQTVAGAALAADAVVGFGPRREGLGGALKGVLFGLVFVGVGWFLFQLNDAGAVREPVDATATVLGVDRSTTRDSDGNTSTSCTPLITFTTVEGREVTTAPLGGSGTMCAYQEGDEVTIQYDASDPSRITGLDALGDRLMPLFPWVFLLVGAFFALSSLWTVLLRATQLGAGIALVARSRARDRSKREAKAAAREAKAAASSGGGGPST